jgi:hypothetical protein
LSLALGPRFRGGDDNPKTDFISSYALKSKRADPARSRKPPGHV